MIHERCAIFARGLEQDLEKIPREHSAIADALIYCDITTSPIGLEITFEERIDEILSRYDEGDIMAKAIRAVVPSLALAVERTQKTLNCYNTEDKGPQDA